MEFKKASEHNSEFNFAMANVYELKEDFPQALRYLQSAYHLSEQIGNRLNSATTLTGLGAVARLMEETALARDYYRKALALAVELDAQPIFERIVREIANRLRFLNNVGLAYLSLDRVLAAIDEAGTGKAGFCDACFTGNYPLGDDPDEAPVGRPSLAQL